MAHTQQRDSAVDRIRERVEAKAARRAAAKAAAEAAARQSTTAPAGPAEHRDHGDGAGQPAPEGSLPRDDADPDRPPPDAPDEDTLPGVSARKPTEIPWHGWKQILKRAWAENTADNMPIIAAGVAFFAFLSIFPALLAMLNIYGLVASPETVAKQVEDMSSALPESARALIADQLTAVTKPSGGALTFGLIASILGALWTASGGVGNLMTAVNIAYDEVETRGFARRKAVALGLTLGAIVFMLITLVLVAVVPAVLNALPLGIVGTVLAQVVRWGVLLLVMSGSLAVLYRIAPDRDSPRLRWVSLGSVLVTVAWALVSLGFSFYVNNFGSYQKTYGAIAGVIVLMLWLYLTAFLILLGAEINSEAEHQTARDTTDGPPQPMGQRDATMADELPDPPVPDKNATANAGKGA